MKSIRIKIIITILNDKIILNNDALAILLLLKYLSSIVSMWYIII